VDPQLQERRMLPLVVLGDGTHGALLWLGVA